jgi:hypothetical protein
VSVRSELLARRLIAPMRSLVRAADEAFDNAADADSMEALYDAAERAREALADADLELVAPGPARRADIANLITECDRVLEQERTR